MMIYGAFAIPIICTIYLLMFHRKDTKWWEILVLFGVCAIAIPAAKFTAQAVQTRDTEWWGNLGTKVVHNEPYDYMSTCTRTVSCGKDCTTIESYPCVQRVSRSCYLNDRRGKGTYISYSKYKELRNRWGTKEKFIDMKRNYHSYDGDRYTADWNKNPILAEPITTEHTWENRVQASSDVFNFPEVTKEQIEQYGLYEYPMLSGYIQVAILDHKKTHATKPYGYYWRYLNGDLGPKRFLRMWVLIFRGKSEEAGRLQEALLKGGNKNEFIYCIGVNKAEEVEWCHIISWTERQKLKIEARNYVAEMGKLDLMKLAKWTEKEVGKRYIKPEFTDKFSYLTVNPSGTAVAISYFIILLINIGVCFWVVKNSHHDHGNTPYQHKTNRRTWKPPRSKRRSGRRRY